MAQETATPSVVRNGVNLSELRKTIRAIQAEPDLAQFRFQARNQWVDGGHNRTTIKGFYGTRQEHGANTRSFELEADEPPVLLGHDGSPNPVEHLLNALATCLTTSLVYHAAARGIELRSVESRLEGDIDLRGFLGIAEGVRKGYEHIRVTFIVDADASPEELETCARFSPVFDVVTHGTKVDLTIQAA